MRVTNNMMAQQVVFNVQRSLQRFFDLQTSLSSGRRINKPSDDPLGTLRDLDFRSELSKISQFQSNIGEGQNWLNSYDSIVNDVGTLLVDVKELAVGMANSTADSVRREASADDVQAIFDRIIQLTNTQLSGRMMFSGFRTKTPPFMVSANGVTYQGDTGRLDFEIDNGILETVNLNGADSFLGKVGVLGEDAELNVGLTLDTLLVSLNSGNGVDQAVGTFTVTDHNLNITSTVDISAATTVDDAITAINNQFVLDGIDITVSLGEEGNNLKLDTTQSGLISTFTSLDVLNNGLGVNLPLGEIRVTDGGGIDEFVDLSAATTVGETITAFNGHMVAAGYPAVTLSVNGAGTGFQIDDASGPPLGLSVENASANDDTADLLGITGDVGASLVGQDLNPQVLFEIAETTGSTAADLGILGTFQFDSPGQDVNPQLTVDSKLTDMFNRLGPGNDRFIMWQGDRSLTVDLTDPTLVTVQDVLDYVNNSSLDVTAEINADGTGIKIDNDDPNRSFLIQDLDGGRAARKMGLYGSSDMMGTLLVLMDALRNDDGDSIGRMIRDIDSSVTQALDVRATVGAMSLRFETTATRLSDMELSFTKLLSDVEDADLTTAITDLATLENNYQAALMAAAKIIQPSLLNFLR